MFGKLITNPLEETIFLVFSFSYSTYPQAVYVCILFNVVLYVPRISLLILVIILFF